MNDKELFKNKIMISSPTSISLGHKTWCNLDAKLVGRVKALLEDIDKLLDENDNLKSDLEYWKEKYRESQNELLNQGEDDREEYIPEIHGVNISINRNELD